MLTISKQNFFISSDNTIQLKEIHSLSNFINTFKAFFKGHHDKGP